MSLVENIINQISTQGVGGVSNLQGLDLNDDTFSKILDKKMETSNEVSAVNSLGQLGMPAGFVIEPANGVEFSDTAKDQAEIIAENKLLGESFAEPIQFKTIDMDDYFTSLIKNSSEASPDFMNFARKQATTAYDVFKKSFVTDMKEFVQDLTSMI